VALLAHKPGFSNRIIFTFDVKTIWHGGCLDELSKSEQLGLHNRDMIGNIGFAIKDGKKIFRLTVVS